MARIFTIDFEFKGMRHAAIVANWKAETQSDWFQVSLNDEALLHLVPEGILRFATSDDSPSPADALHAELVYCLKKAIYGYLQKISA